MEDPESKTTLVSEDTSTSAPLTLCSATVRFKRTTLAMRELCKCAAATLTVQIISAIAIAFMRSELENVPLGRWFVILALCPKCILYVFMYSNLVTGPWGSENSQFWCDVRIMYARGFNTIRTVVGMFSTSGLFVFLSMLLGHASTLSFALLFIMGVLAEWQSGVAENINQHDIKAFDRFISGDVLCLETLHYYQLQHKNDRQRWTAFVICFVIKMYALTCMLATANVQTHFLVFQIPIAFMIVLYTCILPPILHFMYLKHLATFVQLELYRSVMDVTASVLILSFSLV